MSVCLRDEPASGNPSGLPTHFFFNGQVNINPIIFPTSMTPDQAQKYMCCHEGECGTKAGTYSSGHTAYTIASSGGSAHLKHL